MVPGSLSSITESFAQDAQTQAVEQANEVIQNRIDQFRVAACSSLSKVHAMAIDEAEKSAKDGPTTTSARKLGFAEGLDYASRFLGLVQVKVSSEAPKSEQTPNPQEPTNV